MNLSEEQKREVIRFNEEIDNGLHSIESVNCLCGSDETAMLYEHDRYGLWSPTVICIECGLIYSNPRLSPSSYADFYSSDRYREIYEDGNQIMTFRNKIEDWRNNHVFQYLSPLIERKDYHSIIEIGCAAGNNLYGFRECGYEVKGYEYSKGLVDLGRGEYGLDIENGTTIDATNMGAKYDVVILNHVLEHFSNVEEELELVKELVSERGVLYVGVPDLDNFSFGQIQNAHTYYFTPRTFRHYMNKFGFSILSIGPAEGFHMHSILRVDSQTPNCLDEEYRIMIRKIKTMKIKESIRQKLDIVGLGTLAGKAYRLLRTVAQPGHSPDA